MHGRNNGKKLKAIRIIKQALEIVALLNPDANPIQVRLDNLFGMSPQILGERMSFLDHPEQRPSLSERIVRRGLADKHCR